MLTVRHNAGFFSCCNVRLHEIVRFYNEYGVLPEQVDSSEQFAWYKPTGVPSDITHDYFALRADVITVPGSGPLDYYHDKQFEDYKSLDYARLRPFIDRFFTPSVGILELVAGLEAKYGLVYESLCVLFYRGNDKVGEAVVCTYDDMVDRARRRIEVAPETRFLVQSDETEFLERMLSEFPDRAFCFGPDEIRHMKKQISTVDIVFSKENHRYSKLYLAITLIMAKAGNVICAGSGNCSMWIALFRGHVEGIEQYGKGCWY